MVLNRDPHQGYYSVLRWRPDVTRDEAKNVAVLLVDPSEKFGGLRSAPLSRISERLRDQGLLDALVVSLQEQLEGSDRASREVLEEWHRTLQGSLVVTKPQSTAVHDPGEALDALYRAFVRPARGGSSRLTKGRVLDQVVRRLRKSRGDLTVKRGAYVRDFIFDVVVENGSLRSVIEVLSFASARSNWTPIEHDAGHFLYALEHVDMSGIAVVQPPIRTSGDEAHSSYERVSRWLKAEKVPSVGPDEVDQPHLPLFS